MNAISVQQREATTILAATEPVKYPAWKTDYRGPLLIHVAKRGSGKTLAVSSPCWKFNAVIGVVDLADCVNDNHAGGDPDEGGYYWVLTNPRIFVKPLSRSAKVGLFHVADETVVAELARAEVPGERKRQIMSEA